MYVLGHFLWSRGFRTFFCGIAVSAKLLRSAVRFCAVLRYKEPHFRVEPRVAIKIPKMRLKVAMKLLSIFEIEAQGC